MIDLHATVIGAGLAGCEAAWQLVQQGIHVTLIEMKPEKMSPAHHSPLFAELVCSNSLRSDRLTNAVGLLKEEMRLCHSLIMVAADAARVPAGGALAVDRDAFSGYIIGSKQLPCRFFIYNDRIFHQIITGKILSGQKLQWMKIKKISSYSHSLNISKLSRFTCNRYSPHTTVSI